MQSKAALLSVVLIFAVACGGRKPVQTPEQLQAAFAPANNPALAQTKPEVKVWVDQAVTALKADDQVTAVMSLRSLRGTAELTADQAMAINDMMAKAQEVLAERAARGDQQAAAALKMLMINPPR